MGVLLSKGAHADVARLSLLPASWTMRLSAPTVQLSSSVPSGALPSALSQAMSVANQVFGPDSNGLPGSLTDPLSMRSSPFSAGRRMYGPVAWESYGGPAFGWALPSAQMCERTKACFVNPPTLQNVNPFHGLVWAGGGGPVVRLAKGMLRLGSFGSASWALEGSFSGNLVGLQSRQGSMELTTAMGTDFGVGLALGLPRVAIHMQLQTVLFLVVRQASQPLGGQVFATMAVSWPSR